MDWDSRMMPSTVDVHGYLHHLFVLGQGGQMNECRKIMGTY
jgi:hypothetical protein